MTLTEFLEGLAQVDGPTTLTMSPGPYTLNLNALDGRAARILLKLQEEIVTDETTLREAEGILIHNALRRMDPDRLHDDGWYTEDARAFLYAWWWLVFWASQEKGEEAGGDRDT